MKANETCTAYAVSGPDAFTTTPLGYVSKERAEKVAQTLNQLRPNQEPHVVIEGIRTGRHSWHAK